MLSAQRNVVVYDESDEDIQNPERGFYYPYFTYANKYTSLVADELLKLKNGLAPYKDCPFKVSPTLVLRIFVLDGFQKSPLTNDLLEKINDDFTAARKGGVKLVIRFSYKHASTPKFQPPYNDAPLAIVKGHLGQLAPIFKKNADVIALAQLGFIGLWGEGYYTDYYGIPGSQTEQNVIDRVELLDAYLKALPAPLIVQVRHPTMKQDYIKIKGRSALSRIGFHDDAFLASEDDMGTFKSQDASPVARGINTMSVLKTYTQGETSYTAMGGESAAANPPMDKCAAQGGQAEKRLAQFHFSYLNATYHRSVLTGWAPCIEDIKHNLGYRFVLKKGSYAERVRSNDTFSIKIQFRNEGYAAPFNNKTVSLILYNETNKKTYSALIPGSVKQWQPGDNTLNETFTVDSKIPEGRYKLFLSVADVNAGLAKRSEYAVKFANRNIWSEKLVANDLNYTIAVSGQRSGTPIKKAPKGKKVLIIK